MLRLLRLTDWPCFSFFVYLALPHPFAFHVRGQNLVDPPVSPLEPAPLSPVVLASSWLPISPAASLSSPASQLQTPAAAPPSSPPDSPPPPPMATLTVSPKPAPQRRTLMRRSLLPRPRTTPAPSIPPPQPTVTLPPTLPCSVSHPDFGDHMNLNAFLWAYRLTSPIHRSSLTEIIQETMDASAPPSRLQTLAFAIHPRPDKAKEAYHISPCLHLARLPICPPNIFQDATNVLTIVARHEGTVDEDGLARALKVCLSLAEIMRPERGEHVFLVPGTGRWCRIYELPRGEEGVAFWKPGGGVVFDAGGEW